MWICVSYAHAMMLASISENMYVNCQFRFCTTFFNVSYHHTCINQKERILLGLNTVGDYTYKNRTFGVQSVYKHVYLCNWTVKHIIDMHNASISSKKKKIAVGILFTYTFCYFYYIADTTKQILQVIDALLDNHIDKRTHQPPSLPSKNTKAA